MDNRALIAIGLGLVMTFTGITMLHSLGWALIVCGGFLVVVAPVFFIE